jgi:hypothetical protein
MQVCRSQGSKNGVAGLGFDGVGAIGDSGWVSLWGCRASSAVVVLGLQVRRT